MRRNFKLFVENEEGDFEFKSSFETPKRAWDRAQCLPLDVDFQIFSGKKRLIFDNSGCVL
jgi:hypothetical protein